MTTETVTPHRCPSAPERESFWYLVHAEWTKFRTVRGWVIAMVVAILILTLPWTSAQLMNYTAELFQLFSAAANR